MKLEARDVRNKVVKMALEVFMIVLGVLIALGVDEWRQALRMQKTERLYLERLVVDLELNRQIALDFTRWQDQIVRHAWQVYPFIANGRAAESDAMTLIAHAYHATAGPKPVWIDDTLDELKSTGNLALIRNFRVRVRLLRYYRFLQAEDYPFQLTSHDYRESIRSTLDPAIQLRIRAACRREDATCTIDPGGFDAPAFLAWMRENEALARQLTRVITQSSRARDGFLARALAETDAVLALLEQELERQGGARP